ncbi:hypothetical protein Tco_1113636 [Tanacetum coccineum]|uniref:Uncharacterized protein n=1 Tax=Tanacetum coccineum TaxID=301880 RepID=A0ABQ5IVF9_9ASTR
MSRKLLTMIGSRNQKGLQLLIMIGMLENKLISDLLRLGSAKWAKQKTSYQNFDELMSTPIDFSAYVMHNLKIEKLTQEQLVGPAFDLLKGTCRSRVELKFHFEECYKVVTDKLDWHNPEGHEYHH